jgi:hypothetical protein
MLYTPLLISVCLAYYEVILFFCEVKTSGDMVKFQLIYCKY